jgi:hypothetical protein
MGEAPLAARFKDFAPLVAAKDQQVNGCRTPVDVGKVSNFRVPIGIPRRSGNGALRAVNCLDARSRRIAVLSG